jgi:hypothetical protein
VVLVRAAAIVVLTEQIRILGPPFRNPHSAIRILCLPFRSWQSAIRILCHWNQNLSARSDLGLTFKRKPGVTAVNGLQPLFYVPEPKPAGASSD